MSEFRRADAGDARFLVPLVSESSGGVWPAVWKALANDGESVEDSGARYLTDSSNDLSVKNTILIELDGVRVGAMIAYREANPTSAESSSSGRRALPLDLTAALQPYRELSDPNSLFIAELCCLPEARGRGLGAQLLHYAKQSAASQGLPCVSLRVFSENTGAVRLYERSGFHVLGQRPVVPHPDIPVGGSVLFMSCSL